jgi:Domain of unknown function (DUF6249)
MSPAFWFMIAVVATAGVSFTAVVIWLAARTKENEDRQRADLVRRIMESGDSRPALEFLREIERVEGSRTRTKARVAGLINIAVGVGLMIFLAQFVVGAPVYLVGMIPLLVGAALLIFSEFMMKPPA